MHTTDAVSFVDLLEHNALPELAAALRSRIDQIMVRWERAVRQFLPSADRLTFLQLRDDSLAVLRQLADALASTDAAVTATLVEVSRQHAGVRFQEQYDLRELIMEYRLLRRIMIRQVESALQRSMSVVEQVTLHMGIDTMLQRGVLAFVEYQQARLRAATGRATEKAAAAAEEATVAALVASHRDRAAALATSDQDKAAAWATSEEHKDAALASSEQARDVALALSDKDKAAALAASDKDKAAAWATSEEAKDAALATSDQDKAVAWATSEEAKDAALATSDKNKAAALASSEQAKDVALALSDQDKAVALATSEQAKAVAAAISRQAKAIALATSDQARDEAWATAEQAKDIASAISELAAAAATTASRAKDHFLAVLSHELRNPLTPVLATVSLLQLDDRLDPETRQHLEVIRRNAELEARLIDDLLDVTRLSRGKMELDRRPVELCTILRHAVEVCQGDIDARGVHFELAIKDPPHVIHADAGRLQQVFWNLLKNAVKFTPRGGRVALRACRQDDTAVVEVSDSGMGIEPEALRSVFNAFEQTGTSVTREFGGLGLGLTISKAIVEMHGGTITAQSPGKGKGATFTVRLPIANAPLTIEVGIEGALPSRELETQKRELRILLVEDQADTARILSRILTKAGHTVQIAGDVASALELATSAEFDLLLSDMGLPDGSGLDLMKELRRRGNPLRGIALSGYGQEEDVRLSHEAGFSHHLLKPVTAQRLLAVVAGQESGG